MSQSILSFLPFSATTQQASSLNAIETFFLSDDDFILLKGAAGTGKTSIMIAVVDFLASKEVPFQLLAPMGRSAKTISAKTKQIAKTIHSHIYIPHTDTEKAITTMVLKANDRASEQVFIIDESSMISDKKTASEDFDSANPLLTDLIHFIKKGNKASKIIFVGDDCQLQPIGYETQESSPALDLAYLSNKFGLKGGETALTQVMRQCEGSSIFQTAHEIRRNIIGTQSALPQLIGTTFYKPEHAVKLYLDRFDLGKQDKVAIVTFTNAYAKDCNTKIRSRLGLKNTLAVGDTVMLNQSYMGQHYVSSGEIGIVKNLNTKINEVAGLQFMEAELAFKDDSDTTFTVIENVLLNAIDGSYTKAKRKDLFAAAKKNNPSFRNSDDIRDDPFLRAIQLSYGHAITGYKAQGSEWDTVILNTWIPEPDQFRYLYTGVTRARKELFGNGSHNHRNKSKDFSC